MGDVRTRYPWEPAPEPQDDLRSMIEALQRDLAFVVSHTCIEVVSTHPEMALRVNTPRGQDVPKGVCTFTDGTTIEFRDVGAPQVGADEMTVEELTSRLIEISRGLGLEPKNDA